MTDAIVLQRIEPQANMARFYRMQLQPDLFGGVTLCREWGRIGQAGTCRHEHFEAAEIARAALEDLRCAKRRRGYQ